MMQKSPHSESRPSLLRVFPGEREELALAGWAWFYFFCVLAAYYMIRPVREAIGAANGTDKLPWLFAATLSSMLVLHLPFAALTKRLPRTRLIHFIYRFFIANLVGFALLQFAPNPAITLWSGRAFFVWTSVFNLFAVSLFWTLMVDVFRSDQGQRLFGWIAMGGTLGAICGSSATAVLAHRVPTLVMMVGSAVLLELALLAVRRLARFATPALGQSTTQERVVEGSVFSGLVHAVRSPYLLNVALYMLLFTITSTSLYFQQAQLVRTLVPTPEARTALFAQIDLAVNVLTLLAQMFVTARFLRWLGMGAALAAVPLFTAVGFGALAFTPTLGVLIVFQILRRAGVFAIARPAQELLFTVVPREDKYRAKSFIDTSVYRAGDQIGAWTQAGLESLGLSIAGLAFAAVPISVAWLFNGVWLGIRQKALVSATDRHQK